MKLRTIAIGQGTMLVTNEDFLNGYQAGHLACMLDCRAFALGHYTCTNDNITAIMMEKLEDVGSKEQYNVGYCVGWIATFALKGDNAHVQADAGQEQARCSQEDC